jgi:hypothetical protein
VLPQRRTRRLNQARHDGPMTSLESRHVLDQDRAATLFTVPAGGAARFEAGSADRAPRGAVTSEGEQHGL